MAAEPSAKDVLCEAMEYLSKLGSNLRSRSVNMLGKKYRPEKLNNVLAVQKAASKLLMICELSKKSLDNVESGVRNALDGIDKLQASFSKGGKKYETEKVKKRKYYYFDYKTRTLRIKSKISYKHYSSVRVHAKMLPKCMMDKYPVNYDCKLYRMRKKEMQEVQKTDITDEEAPVKSDVAEISIPDTTVTESADKNNKNDNLKNDVSIISIPDSPEPGVGDDNKIDRETLNKNRKKSCFFEQRKEHNATSDDEDESTVNKSSKKDHKDKRRSSDHSSDQRKSSKRKIIMCDNSSGDEMNMNIDDTKNKSDLASKKDTDVSCCESNSKKQKLEENASHEEEVSPNMTPVDEDMPKKIDDNDESSNDSQKPMIKCVSLSKLLKPAVLEKEKASKPLSKTKVKSHKEKENEDKTKQTVDSKQVQKSEEEAKQQKEEEYWKEKRKEVRSFKSKEFVIKITRLPELTPDYLKNSCLNKITQDGKTICEINDEINCKTNGPEVEARSGNREEAKSNSRHVSTNSGSDNDSALIAEANKVKNSLLNESDSDDAIGSDNELKACNENTKNIKSSLLNDSDSDTKKSNDGSKSDDQSDKDTAGKAEQAKKALCNESDSGSDKNDPKSSNDVQKGKSPQHNEVSDSDPDFRLTLESDSDSKQKKTESSSEKPHNDTDGEKGDKKKNESDSDSSKNNENLSESKKNEEVLEEEDSKKAKSSLLNDSPDRQSETPLVQRLSPQAKKKRIRESIHAKKMLLTYSSSDTEDEKLKNVLGDIKQSLLRGSEDENKKENQSKGSNPSSSDGDITKMKNQSPESNHSKKKRPKHKRKKHRRRVDSSNSSGNSDSNLTSSSSKMVRSKSKPGNSSSLNSDAADCSDKDIDGLTNFKTLNKSRRRNSNSSEMSTSSATEEKPKKEDRKVKPTGFISEVILKAESSSESVASAEENEADEDLPTITLPGVNGQHLAKDDLLGESDSSVSHIDDVKSVKEESGSEDKPNVKRRKANAISSDSEVGSSRKKDADVRLSDFDESDDSDVKRSKRKKKNVDSDASVGTSSSNEGGKKKRRRIKSVRDSDASGSESETDGRNKHGRKNIRKVMGKNQLEEATKKAAREEKERIARIAERQKMYNNLEFDESGKPDEVVLDKVILDFDPETKEPLIEVDRGLVKKLKPHQANGIKFMWNACFESVKRIKKDRGSGCILAHCMGLGKTLQVVSLTHTLLTHCELTSVNRVLVVCPLSTVLNWVNEFRMWLKYSETEYEVEVYELSKFKQNSERAFQLSQWFRHGGVCVLGYEMFRNLSADNVKKFKKKMLKNFQEALVDPGPDLVVCDEGHLLKNEKTSLSQSMNRIKTHRRIVLTGTPLQNNLKEYYCMVQFVKPNLLGKYNEYLNRFVNPITNGQYTDSTEHDIKIMKRRSHVLHKMLDGAVQRRDYGVLAPFLPPKHEYVLFLTLAEVQVRLYQHYLDNFSRKPLPGKSSGFLFPDFQSLQRIWTHPLVLKYNSEKYEKMQQKKRDKEEEELDSDDSINDFIDDSTPEESMTEESSDDSSDLSDDSRKKSKKKKSGKKGKGKDGDKPGKGDGGHSRPRRGTRANPGLSSSVELEEEEDKDDDVIEMKYENPTEWWIKLVTEEELDDMRNSHKLVLLFDILRQCEAIGDKLLVFSQSLYSLDLIEYFLGKVDDATQEGRIDEKLGGHIGTWSPGLDYFRLDGSTSCENRSIWCKNFNREDNPRARLFLISTRAGGLGINLVAANRVVIFDVSWNPSHDVQSIFRVYRFGQKKPCYVYRLLAMGTMEEKIYERQVTKQAISKRVIDEQQIDRHYAENDLAELYKFEPQPPSPRPIPPLPKDRLFAEMLREHEVQIYKYHEHDSLLENKEEETLSEEERKAAWEDFENEKNRPPPAPFPNTWQMPNLLQQQQLAYATIAAMLRKDVPNLSDNQLRDVIYSSNPQVQQLMQKLGEMYKYSPGMMNPAMMNPGVMNAAGSVGGMSGMGGASGLQYEPPWQRQQQQQQQMRLQQLLQHQSPMGAKFYSGGLGSRDPIAMALQQQRAREIMLGGGGPGAASRPRGRPPLAPRAPPADVVTLDSD